MLTKVTEKRIARLTTYQQLEESKSSLKKWYFFIDTLVFEAGHIENHLIAKAKSRVGQKGTVRVNCKEFVYPKAIG